MAKTKPIKDSSCCMPVSVEDWEQQMRTNQIGAEPPGGIPQRSRPEATRTTARPWSETDNRKPYLPTEDVSTPSLDEGLSFRQSF